MQPAFINQPLNNSPFNAEYLNCKDSDTSLLFKSYHRSGKFRCKKKLCKAHTSTKLKHTRFFYYDNFTFE